MAKARFIDVDGFIEDLKAEFSNLMMDGLKGTPRIKSLTFSEVVERIECQPTADVRENVRGEWKYIPEKGQLVCTNCEKHSPWHEKYDFCPNCGADMRGGAENG